MVPRAWVGISVAVICLARGEASAQGGEGTEKEPQVLADLDPDNDWTVAPPAPIPDCEDRLRAAGVVFAPA